MATNDTTFDNKTEGIPLINPSFSCAMQAANLAALGIEYLSPRQLAHVLGVSLRTLQRWHQLRTGPQSTRIGSKRVYRKAAIQSWLRACEEPEVSRKRRA